MRVLTACAIVISAALGLAGRFHHQQPLLRRRCRHRPSNNERAYFPATCPYRCRARLSIHSTEPS